MRSLSNGFALQRPEAEELESTFISVCSRHEDIDVTDDGMLLKVPQTDHGEGPIDTVDRVVLGAAFLQELVAAGL